MNLRFGLPTKFSESEVENIVSNIYLCTRAMILPHQRGLVSYLHPSVTGYCPPVSICPTLSCFTLKKGTYIRL